MSKFKPSDKPRNTKSGTLRRLTEAQRKGKIGQELDELSELQLHVKKEYQIIGEEVLVEKKDS